MLKKYKKNYHINLLIIIAGNIFTFILLLSVLFLIGEIYYRLFYDKPDSFGLTLISERWFARHYQYNNRGIRDNIEYNKMSAPGKRRISFLGDSYTVGHGIKNVDKRFANQVRNMMKDEWEVQVLAGNGLDTGAELYVLESYIKAGFQFDNLILIYCLNDISDIIPKFKNILKEIYKGKKSEGFFLKNSYFINLLYYRFVRGRNPNISNYYGFVRDAYYSNHWEDQKNRLHLLCKLCHSRGINLMVVTFPFLHALDNGYEYGEIHEKLNKFWKEQKIPYLDLLSIYEGHKASELIISRYDAHPNEYAHSLAAEAIKNFIIRKD